MSFCSVRRPSAHPATARRASLLALAAGTAGLWAFPIHCGIVVGRSMEPTFRSGQPFLFAPYRPGDSFRRGEVVVLRMERELAVKRVYAVGGERIWTTRFRGSTGRDYPVDSSTGQIPEWRARYPSFQFAEKTVPLGTLYVLGDSCTSQDSRDVGPIPVKEVVGRVILADGAAENWQFEGSVWSAPPCPVRPRGAGRRPLPRRKAPAASTLLALGGRVAVH